METESIGSSIGSFSLAPSFGSEIGSSFSFADTVSYSAPDISGLDGGSYNPSFNLADSIPYTADIGSISLDTRLGMDFCQTSVPQVFKDAFREDNLLEPETFLESINKIDLTETKPQNNIIEQLITSPEPETIKTEAKIAEIFEEPLTAPKIEKIVEEIQELTVQTSVIPSEVEDRTWESTKLVEDCRAIARNDNNELAVSYEQITSVPGIALPGMQQSIQTYEALINAGIETEQVGILVEQALIRAGTEPEIAEKVVGKLKTEEEEKKKKRKLKFVVDEKALNVRQNALKNALEKTPVEIKDGREVIDSNKVAALMPTEVEKPSVKSNILPQYEIELFGIELGDGSHRETIEAIKGMGLRNCLL